MPSLLKRWDLQLREIAFYNHFPPNEIWEMELWEIVFWHKGIRQVLDLES